MSKIRRAGFVFLTWKGDHGPKHVHVYKNGQFVMKWDIEDDRLMEGTFSRSAHDTIKELQSEGQL